jgi:hypothetical protein
MSFEFGSTLVILADTAIRVGSLKRLDRYRASRPDPHLIRHRTTGLRALQLWTDSHSHDAGCTSTERRSPCG